MKRIALRLVLFLLLGAIITVAVAWGCAIGVHVESVASNQGQSTAWQVLSRKCQGAHIVESLRRRGMDPDPRRPARSLVPQWSPVAKPTAEWASDEVRVEWRVIDCRGWPINSMYCEIETRYAYAELRGVRTWPARWGFETGLPARTWSTTGRVEPPRLPLRPIPFGFFIDTILFTVPLWAATLGRTWAKRVTRKKRGLCVQCGYDLRGGAVDSSVCPECGANASTSS